MILPNGKSFQQIKAVDKKTAKESIATSDGNH
jgi:hypothetical protein